MRSLLVPGCIAVLASAAGCSRPAAGGVAPANGQNALAKSGVESSDTPAALLGQDFPLRSSGDSDRTGWRLTESGYVGTYLRVAREGTVRLALEASGVAGGSAAPRLALVIADESKEFEVGSERAAHELGVVLPAGTYVLRADFENAAPETGRAIVIHQLVVSGAEVLREHVSANALDAANTYIENFRRGAARVKLDGVAPGTRVKVSLDRHAFGFGANIPFAENKLIPEVVPAGSDAERFQRLLLDHFNTVVLSNGGKWIYHEAERDQVQMAYVDRFLQFAAEHDLTARMHTLIWDTEQQPAWVVSTDSKTPGLLTRAHGGDTDAKRDLLEEIDERIDYYVKQRARHYLELDVLNESLHRPRYHQVLGDEGLAELFRRVDAAAKAGGADTRLYLNEYNLLQWSTDPRVPDSAPDPYANWYRRHAEAVLGKGGPMTGLGVQYYADGRSSEEIGENAHSAARILGVLHNLSGVGLHLTLSEFAVNPGNLPPDRGADVLEETLRIAFGTRQVDAFLIWATWANAAQKPPPLSILMDEKNELTPAGIRYEALLKEWDTELEVPVGADGSLEFVGFFGRYALSTSEETRCFTLSKGTREYAVTAAARVAASSAKSGSSLCRSARGQ